MSRWFRFYDDAVNDPKVQRLPGDKFKVWVNLLCLSSRNDGILPKLSDIAFTLRLSEEKVSAILNEFCAGLLLDPVEVVGAPMSYAPHNWDGRQYKSDTTDPTAPTRQKRYRDRKRNDRNATVTVERPEAETEQIQSRADARDESQKRAGDFRQAIVQTYAESKSPTLPDTSRAQLWLSQGYDPEICLAVIASIVPKKPNVSLSYFDNPIKEAHASKAPKRKPIGGPVPLDWDAILTSYKKFGHWSRDAGNDPTSPGCRAPPDLLRKHGFEPVSTQ